MILIPQKPRYSKIVPRSLEFPTVLWKRGQKKNTARKAPLSPLRDILYKSKKTTRPYRRRQVQLHMIAQPSITGTVLDCRCIVHGNWVMSCRKIINKWINKNFFPSLLPFLFFFFLQNRISRRQHGGSSELVGWVWGIRLSLAVNWVDYILVLDKGV